MKPEMKSQKEQINSVYLTIRKITAAPVMAAVMLTVLKLIAPEIFQPGIHFVFAVFFLGLLPLLAYPMQKHIPAYRDKGREGQRNLAMVFAVSGYVLGIITVLFARAPKEIIIIYLEYLFSGILIFVFNRCLHLKISGHACGVFGPVAIFLSLGFYTLAVMGGIVSIFVYISSLQTKRHTLLQLIGGSIIPFIVMLSISFWR